MRTKTFETITIANCEVPVAVTAQDKVYFSPRHICEALGIDWSSQLKKIKADPVLSACVVEIPTLLNGQTYYPLMLPKEVAQGWLFTIKKVDEAVQEKLNAFRMECFIALDTWFNKGLREDTEVMEKYDVKLEQKAQRYDLLQEASGSILVKDVAEKISEITNECWTDRRLNKHLKDVGVQYSQTNREGKHIGWRLKSKYFGQGLTTTKIEEVNGRMVKCQTKWTPKGLDFIIDLITNY